MTELWVPVDGVFTTVTTLWPSWSFTKNFGWFSFLMTTIGTLAGAFAGAWAAQRHVEKSKACDTLAKNLQATNRSIMLGLSTLNVALALKKQCVQEMKEQYDADCKRLEAYIRLPHPKDPFHASLMLTQLQHLNAPVEALQTVVLQQSSDKSLRAFTSMNEAIELLNNSIDRRNNLIDRFKSGDIPEGFNTNEMYFGLPVNGQKNQEYGSTVEGIHLYNNDAIFFSLKLCEYLREHGLKVSEKYKKVSGQTLGVCEINVTQALNQGLLPYEPEHKEWEEAFVEQAHAARAKCWWQLWRR